MDYWIWTNVKVWFCAEITWHGFLVFYCSVLCNKNELKPVSIFTHFCLIKWSVILPATIMAKTVVVNGLMVSKIVADHRLGCLKIWIFKQRYRLTICITFQILRKWSKWLWRYCTTNVLLQPFYSSLDFVHRNLGKLLPKETFTHSHL